MFYIELTVELWLQQTKNTEPDWNGSTDLSIFLMPSGGLRQNLKIDISVAAVVVTIQMFWRKIQKGNIYLLTKPNQKTKNDFAFCYIIKLLKVPICMSLSKMI